MARLLRSMEFMDIDVVCCHAFSPDLSLLALCPNNEEVHIFRLRGNDGYQPAQVLAKHTQRVTGLAWSSTGRLASVSEDRTAYVWDTDQDGTKWTSCHAELRTPRAALCVAWAPNSVRFAVGLSSKDVALCHFEELAQCWVAKKVGRSKAAVGAIAWHPTSQFLATGSTDQRCQVYDVNEAGDASFGEAQVTESAGSWVNAVAFSTSGRVLAFAPQDSTVRFKDLVGGPSAVVDCIRWRRLPFLQVVFMSDTCLVACGFDCVPVLFRHAGSWALAGAVNAGPKVPAVPSTAKRESFAAARNKFGATTKDAAETKSDILGSGALSPLHTNTITNCHVLGEVQFSTSGLDGQIAIWELSA